MAILETELLRTSTAVQCTMTCCRASFGSGTAVSVHSSLSLNLMRNLLRRYSYSIGCEDGSHFLGRAFRTAMLRKAVIYHTGYQYPLRIRHVLHDAASILVKPMFVD